MAARLCRPIPRPLCSTEASPLPEPVMLDLLDPKNDYVFKRLFADAPTLLAALINAVRFRSSPITRIEVKNPQIEAEELAGKYIVLDLLGEDEAGGWYDIEM
jgi:hypothetical protein